MRYGANIFYLHCQVDGSAADFGSLEIVVFATLLTLPPGGMFPVPGKPHPYHSITYGRPGGSKEAPVDE